MARLPVPFSAGLVTVLSVASFAACDRAAPSSSETQEAPASSVIALGVSLGGCEDLGACARECDAGSADRCRRLAISYAQGRGAPKDETRATELYEHACAMGDSPACIFAGQMHEYAHGVPRDETAAAQFYGVACERRSPAGCYNLAYLSENARILPRDLQKARELYAVACAAGARQACDRAKDLADARE
jgi:TPR repeat protein